MVREVVSDGTLYVVATPLGNLSDLSHRAAQTLGSVEVVAAEDTRRARTLLAAAGARPRVLSFHAHSPPARARQVLDLLGQGKSVALVTDAGTPTISDPGATLVRQAREAGHRVKVIPGPSAVTAALSISGIPADRYIFLGFIPRRGPERRRLLDLAAGSSVTAVIFESAARLTSLLDDLAARCGPERRVAIGRELTKIHEELRTGTAAELAVYYREHPPRGEVTVVLSGQDAGTREVERASRGATLAEASDRARALLAAGKSRRDAAAAVVEEFGMPRNEAYRMVTAL